MSHALSLLNNLISKMDDLRIDIHFAACNEGWEQQIDWIKSMVNLAGS
jgi:hypothetical protein